MSALLFGIKRRERTYVARYDLKEQLFGALVDSVDRKHHAARKKSSTLIDEVMRHGARGAARLYDHGRDAFNTKVISWTGDTQKAVLLDLTSSSGAAMKLITAASNANPVVYTCTSNGFANNDVVVAGGIGGNLSANQTGLVTAQATNSFSLNTLEGLAVAGSGAYTSGGYAMNLTSAVFVTDVLGNRVGTDPTIAGTSSSKGIANATSPITWTTVPAGSPAQCVVFYDAAGGTDGTNRVIAFQDGKVRVVVDKAVIATDTTIVVEPLRAQLWDGVTGSAPVLFWSDGHSSTLNASAAQGARSITVTSQAAGGVAIGSTADVLDFGGGLPVTPSGGSISFTIGTILAPLTPTGIYEL